MNREILFRGKRVDDSKWVYDYYLVAGGMSFISTFGEKEPIRVIPETVGQFTGLKDKNGTKIFEGDIVIYLPYSDIFKVYWNNETFGWQLECIDSSEDDVGWVEYLSEFGSKDLEVIGNIHDKEVTK